MFKLIYNFTICKVIIVIICHLQVAIKITAGIIGIHYNIVS